MSTDTEQAKKKYRMFMDRMYIPTTPQNLIYMLNGKVKILHYTDLDKLSSIDELISPYNCAVILYPHPYIDNAGHWTCIFVHPDSKILEYFDSYGRYIDANVADYNEMTLKPIKLHPKLLEIILNSSNKYDDIHFNEEPYQNDTYTNDKGEHIADCGLWCVIRLKHMHLNEYDFGKLFYDLPWSEGILPDAVVSTMICNMYPEMCHSSVV